MKYLLLSILCASLIFLIFKAFKAFKVHSFQAIVINYFTAGIFGFLLLEKGITLDELTHLSWFPLAIGIGAAFILLFNLMALVTQKMGASVASVTVKMALIIPVCLAFILYDDKLTFLKILGITAALIGIYLSTKQNKKDPMGKKQHLLLIIVLFLGSGLMDSVMKYAQESQLNKNEYAIMLFTPLIFISAAIFGSLILGFKSLIQNSRIVFSKMDILWGIVLGIVNYGSIFFLLKALDQENWESSIVFSMNNMGIVFFTTLMSFFIFKENLSRTNVIGIFISIISIGLIALSI